jgi:protein-S-isoprenylcysteine O-methyltransferase Ste14
MNLRFWVSLTVEFLAFAALLFGSAGTIRWIQAWAFLAIFFACALGISFSLSRHDPELLRERLSAPADKRQPLWDKVILGGVALAWCGWLALMGLDAVRFRWSHLPVWLEWAGGAGIVLSFWAVNAVFRANTFLAVSVKIQEERGHHVVSTGPYAIVRHPMYACVVWMLPCCGLLLGSAWGTAGSLAIIGGIVIRTAMEDAKLHRELKGYPEYAARVRYRLVPMVW